MKLDKKKIVFGIIIGLVIIFMVVYSMAFLTNGDDNGKQLAQPLVPQLEEAKKEYSSKLEAINDLKEVKTTNAPSIYDEKFLDSTGLFDPDLIYREKAQIVDSIYRLGRIDYTQGTYRKPVVKNEVRVSALGKKTEQETVSKPKEVIKPTLQEMALEQQLFFASDPLPDNSNDDHRAIPAIVERTQTIRANDRLEFRTLKEVVIDGRTIPKNTVVFGMVAFQPNRVVLDIENIDHIPIKLKAYDYRDGLEGLYIRNTFRAEAYKEMVDGTIDDINVPGVPQIKGLKNIFKRSNRKVRATVNKNYKILLKTSP
ncbi:conjugative transposon protein TraM [Allomuricauda sp. F6463D]|uniref:conjugative transposon protein TraM n=1 Tax=Allomuricauda sp. F6463D TaxID=2926409 RepID=UPI001FF27B34|nr:conjugative transposon protein TraM [Muricauda sp. F6463D]MCK0160465.1 conjugative transposon protein TraM [Muricauda sp. F6463D]